MSKFYFLIIALVLFSGWLLIFLLGDLPNYRGTIVHKLHILLVEKFTNWISNLFVKIDKRFFNGYLSSDISIERFKWISGWIIPLFYLLIFTQAISYFFQYTYSQILSIEQQKKFHSYSLIRFWIFMIPAIFCNYFSFILAVVSDPGYLTDNDLTYNKSTKIQSEFPYDNLIYYETQCSTCKFNKPSRSKHCSVCDKCVLMFDHHCVWLNNDVAYYTYRWFLLFLFSMCYIIIYGGYLCFYSLNLFMKYSDDIPKNIHKLPFFRKYWLLIKQTNFANEVSGTILLLCILIFPLIAFFFGENLWSIYLGVTTNETGKWSYINQLIEHELLYEFIPKNGDLHTFLILNGKLANGSIQFVTLKEKTPFNSSIGGNLKQIKGWSDMDNIYDKGFWNNFFQRMFPKKL